MENTNQSEVEVSASTQASVPASTTTIKKPKLTPVFDILREAISLWWKNLDKILKVYWEGIKLALIPLAVIFVLVILNFAFINGGAISTSLKMLAGVAGFIGMVFVMYYMIRAYMGVFILVKNNYAGEAKEIFKETRDIFWPYIGLSLLTAALVILWLLLLIIPGLVFSIIYSFAIYAFFFEGKRGMEAIRRSRSLVKSYFWPVCGRILLLGFLIWIFTAVLSIPLNTMSKESMGYVLWSTVVQIISFLIGPIALLFSYRIYSDLVKIKQ